LRLQKEKAWGKIPCENIDNEYREAILEKFYRKMNEEKCPAF
jgi:hypothetical protein